MTNKRLQKTKEDLEAGARGKLVKAEEGDGGY